MRNSHNFCELPNRATPKFTVIIDSNKTPFLKAKMFYIPSWESWGEPWLSSEVDLNAPTVTFLYYYLFPTHIKSLWSFYGDSGWRNLAFQRNLAQGTCTIRVPLNLMVCCGMDFLEAEQDLQMPLHQSLSENPKSKGPCPPRKSLEKR